MSESIVFAQGVACEDIVLLLQGVMFVGSCVAVQGVMFQTGSLFIGKFGACFIEMCVARSR